MTFPFQALQSAHRKSRRAASVAILLTLALPHLTFAQGTPVSGGTLTWGVETQPHTLNPQLNGQDKVELLLRNAYESLLAQKPDGSFVPWLATGYKVSADGKTYTFTLRDGVKFTDGAPFDAQAVARNFLNARNLTYSAGSNLAHLIAHVNDVKTPDAHTVEITLDAPYSPFLTFAGHLPLVSPNAFDKPSLKSGGPDIAGTGPFILRRYVKGQQIEFIKNPDYRWAPSTAGHQGPAYLDSVVYRFLPESSVRTGALLSGQVDVIEGVSGNDASLIRKNTDLSLPACVEYRHTLFAVPERHVRSDAGSEGPSRAARRARRHRHHPVDLPRRTHARMGDHVADRSAIRQQPGARLRQQSEARQHAARRGRLEHARLDRLPEQAR